MATATPSPGTALQGAWGTYINDDGDRVIDVIDTHDDAAAPITALTSEVGLSGERHTGDWTHFALPAEE